ncbi:MAG: hypothetical protein PF904_18705 [Kiritimatiellae bacterium]|nr:hypothetical protein [Kiritimatiellia bacterium]
MIDQGRFLIISICATAALLTANAQDNEAAASKTPAAVIDKQVEVSDMKFANLVRVINIQGICEVNNPDLGEFKQAKHNKAYPMGSIFRTGANSKCILIFSAADSAIVTANSELMVTACKKTCQSLTLKLITGEIQTTLRDNLSDGSFSVNTPNCDIINISGRGSYTLGTEEGNEILKASTITGTARVEGPHYTIPALQAANKVNITTDPNRSFSRLTSVSGDFAIELSNGTEEPIIYKMSPKALVKIWRESAPVGGRTIVSTLVVSPTGMARHRFAYAEGRKVLKTGELVKQESDQDLPDFLSDNDKESAGKDDSAL